MNMQTMTPEQEESVVKRLLSGTQSKKVTWDATVDPYAFMTSDLGRFMYMIICKDDDDVAPFRLDILDTSGPEVTVIHSVETSDFGMANDELSALYVLVKKRVLGIDNIAFDILSELDKFGLTD